MRKFRQKTAKGRTPMMINDKIKIANFGAFSHREENAKSQITKKIRGTKHNSGRPSVVFKQKTDSTIPLNKQTTIGSIESTLKSPRYSNSQTIIIPDASNTNSPRKLKKPTKSQVINEWAENGAIHIRDKDRMKSELQDDYHFVDQINLLDPENKMTDR